jgi:VanZ family protein
VSARVVSLWAPVVIYMAAIFYVSSLPQPALPPGGDKPWHLLGYAGFGIVVARAFAGGFCRRVGRMTALLAIAFGIAYGVTDEIHQMFVPGRSAEVADLIADSCGVVLGTVACWACGIIAPFSRDEL